MVPLSSLLTACSINETGRYRRFIGDTPELGESYWSRALAGNDGTVWRSIPPCDSSAVAVTTNAKVSSLRNFCVRFCAFHELRLSRFRPFSIFDFCFFQKIE